MTQSVVQLADRRLIGTSPTAGSRAYKGGLLGPAWSLIDPLATLAVSAWSRVHHRFPTPVAGNRQLANPPSTCAPPSSSRTLPVDHHRRDGRVVVAGSLLRKISSPRSRRSLARRCRADSTRRRVRAAVPRLVVVGTSAGRSCSRRCCLVLLAAFSLGSASCLPSPMLAFGSQLHRDGTCSACCSIVPGRLPDLARAPNSTTASMAAALRVQPGHRLHRSVRSACGTSRSRRGASWPTSPRSASLLAVAGPLPARRRST